MEYNFPIKPGMIPSTLKELTLPHDYNHPLQETFAITNDCLDYIPVFPENGLTKLYITNSFNQPIIQNVLPKTLKELKIGTSFTQELYFESIPDSVTFLTLDCPYYNHQFAPGILPRNLIKLKIGNNVPLLPGSLPESLTYLKLCRDFNQPITANLLPKNLKKISFGSNFQSNFVPSENIHTIVFGENMLCEPHSFTENVRSVVVKNHRHNELPNTINELIIVAKKKIHKRFPVNLNYLELNCPDPFQFQKDQLKPLTGLKHLRLLSGDIRIQVNQIPISLISLDLGGLVSKDPLDLSPLVNLEYFSLGGGLPQNITSPPTLRAMKFYGDEVEEFSNTIFPASLEILQLPQYHVQPLSNSWLPSSLKILIHPGEPVIAEDYRRPNLIKFYVGYLNETILIYDRAFLDDNPNIVQSFKNKHNVIIEDYLNYILPCQINNRYSEKFYMADN
ncbi:hypothetical protein DICPUDRAFT_91719 [Dictyostelium purpureum]|uniref:FNIP repeat-containing protein n=1 Tax=Dictyostelium purpureum TaxID=5786 RepID=F0ZGD3_DICPU|nr:uncharacterized protein DICPUDRAFT_91719 [Dictyostelium purpureum]EGC36991.1 hypothetical protein DICPUDRAFT_91719 [Dictyostelium purpureum]|eukprot:XP_003286488.1 hypothetical protein DICPUDRAFT_91719 [Dictyostelium purpureum]